MTRVKILAATGTAIAMAAALGTAPEAYSTFARWTSTPVNVYINPANADLDPAAAEAALRTAMDEWNTRSGSSFQYLYIGQTTDTTSRNDGRNVVLFRNATNNGALASTYSWWSGSTMLDSDVIFWDASYTFFTGTAGCGGAGAYVEDIAVHEFGHALGLDHSTAADATMYPTYYYCSQEMRSLAADDMAGAQALYPVTAPATNTAPALTVSAPGSFTTITAGTSLTFSGSASDKEEGTLTPRLSWVSNIDGQIGVGGSFSRVLSTGTHAITVSVTDGGGLSASKSLTVTAAVATPSPTPTPTPTSPSLTVRTVKVKGLPNAELTWGGLNDARVTIYRNNAGVASITNSGKFNDAFDRKISGSYQYKVCGTTSGICTNAASVSF